LRIELNIRSCKTRFRLRNSSDRPRPDTTSASLGFIPKKETAFKRKAAVKLFIQYKFVYLFVIHLVTYSDSGYTASNGISSVNNELEGMWKETLVA
jgi:hypothetical protein